MKWTEKPITWGAYAKLSAIAVLIGIAVPFAWLYMNRIAKLFDNMYERISRLWNRKDREP